MKRRRPAWLGNAKAHNPFRLMQPSQRLLAKARAAGVDASNKAAYDYWRRTGRVNNTGEIE